MVGMPEVNLGVDLGMAGGVQKVRDEREWIAILFSDFVKASEVNAQPEGAILLLYEEDRSSVRGSGRTDETCF